MKNVEINNHEICDKIVQKMIRFFKLKYMNFFDKFHSEK